MSRENECFLIRSVYERRTNRSKRKRANERRKGENSDREEFIQHKRLFVLTYFQRNKDYVIPIQYCVHDNELYAILIPYYAHHIKDYHSFI